MSEYTELLNIRAETLSPDDDGYEESLLETAKMFRGFGDALTSFMEEHGYEGNPADAKEKTDFLRKKFREAGLNPPRNCDAWFISDRKPARKTAFQICFAFGLDVEETDDFFRCVQLERSFDCHNAEEAVCYFCIKNDLSYMDAKDIIARIPDPEKQKAVPDSDVLYTGTIIEYINSIDDKEKLIQYIENNIEDFRYRSATAVRYIRELWAKISGKTGPENKESDEYNLAAREGELVSRSYNRFQEKSRRSHVDTRSREVIAEETRREAEIKLDDRVAAGDGASTWTIFSQIIGLDNKTEMKFASEYNRSLTSVLSENALLPLNADYCFPSRQIIDKALRGEPGEHESMRKLLIFLSFYNYWANIVTAKNDAFYTAKHADSERCMDTVNGRLLDAGYPELYAGNPYDWLFMWSMNDEHPLDAFRTYMGEVFAVKGEAQI